MERDDLLLRLQALMMRNSLKVNFVSFGYDLHLLRTYSCLKQREVCVEKVNDNDNVERMKQKAAFCLTIVGNRFLLHFSMTIDYIYSLDILSSFFGPKHCINIL